MHLLISFIMFWEPLGTFWNAPLDTFVLISLAPSAHFDIITQLKFNCSGNILEEGVAPTIVLGIFGNLLEESIVVAVCPSNLYFQRPRISLIVNFLISILYSFKDIIN